CHEGEKLLERPGYFAYQLADLYKRNGNISGMIEQYLFSLQAFPDRIQNIQNLPQRSLQPEDYADLLSQLYVFMQDYPDTDYFPEMLAWTYMQQKDYSRATRQTKALVKRMGENGLRVYRL